MGISDEVKKKAFELLGDPRILQILQNEQVVKVLGALAQVPGMLHGITDEQAERIAKTFKLATADDMVALRRAVNRLERDLAELEARVGAPKQ
jgi:hypothetical protein